AEAALPFPTHPKSREQRFLFGLTLVLLVAALLVAWPYRSAVLLAVVLGFLLQRPYQFLLRHLRWKPVAAGAMLLLVAVAIVLPFAFIGASLAEEVQQVASNLQRNGFQAEAESFASRLGVPDHVVGPAFAQAQQVAGGFLQGMGLQLVWRTVDFLLGTLVFFFLLYFLLKDGPALLGWLRRVSPLDNVRTNRLLKRSGENTRAIVLGTLVVGLVQGVAAGVGWWIFGFPQPVFWGFVMTLIAILPFAGPFFVFMPAGIWAIAQGDLFSGVGLIVWGVVLVGLIDDVVRPVVIGKRSGVHPAIILLGIVGGVPFFGFTGFILGPLILSLFPLVLEAWSRPENEPLRKPGAGGA
ncbi:MAG TPA: AI-2E family transporter, partial [Candidatus Thermoplasmatota archaeon]|nr:AI-2E family transporter [Candidatus Thermoplasmatota archaeon]